MAIWIIASLHIPVNTATETGGTEPLILALSGLLLRHDPAASTGVKAATRWRPVTG
jgi:hypothetical protein